MSPSGNSLYRASRPRLAANAALKKTQSDRGWTGRSATSEARRQRQGCSCDVRTVLATRKQQLRKKPSHLLTRKEHSGTSGVFRGLRASPRRGHQRSSSRHHRSNSLEHQNLFNPFEILSASRPSSAPPSSPAPRRPTRRPRSGCIQ